MMELSMDAFFNPRSIAIIGASNKPFNLGATICEYLTFLNYDAKIYAINRKGEDVKGCKGYQSLLEIPHDVDLAIILTPAPTVPDVIEECGKKGIQAVIIETAGFTEEGEYGKQLQKQVNEIAKRYTIRFIGPNCLGTLNAHNRFCCFFGARPGEYDGVFERPGDISYVIQSGGVGVLIMDSLRSDIVNVNKMMSIGNKEDIDEADCIDYFNTDGTKVIGMYLESIKNGKRFLEAAKHSSIPILVYKVGRTNEGAKAAMSHTAGMANNDIIFDAACRQVGIIRCKAISELHSMPKIFTTMPLLKGKRIAIFTNSGAFGGITSDLLVEAGFEIPTLSGQLQQRIAQCGKLYNVSNPIDLGPTLSLQTFIDIFTTLLSSDEIDGICAVPNVWQQVVIDGILELMKLCKEYDKPAGIYIPNAVDRILKVRTAYSIPSFESPEEAVRALQISYQYYCASQKKSFTESKTSAGV
jgi:acetyltransferase